MLQLKIATLTVLFATNDAFAHGAERGLVMLLPTEFYVVGGGCAVLLSFLLLTFAPYGCAGTIVRRSIALLPAFSISKTACSLGSFAFLAICTLAGFFSVHDPLSNPLPLVIWTGWWVGLTLLQALIGSLWPWLNPWTGLLWLGRKLTGTKLGRRPCMSLPYSIGYLPAIVQFAFFAWFELISLAPEDPPRLAYAVTAYWLLNLTAIVVFGEDEWMKRGEPFSVFFRMLGLFAPFIVINIKGRKKICLTWPGRKCLDQSPLPLSGTFFVLLTLGTASFDGFSETFTWLGLIGVNPLEFPGRSGVTIPNTIGLAVAPLLLTTIFYVSVATGAILAGRTDRGNVQALAGRLVYSIIPISVAFHSAHYLTQLLINGQYLLIVMSDPFALDWNLIGTVDMHVTTSFLQNLHDVRIIWTAQTLMIVGGHIAGIVVAHVIAESEFSSNKMTIFSQLCLAIMMVFYTVFGLWLLSTPSVG